MCTLTLLRAPWADQPPDPGLRWRVVFNRDEQRSRCPALPPVNRTYAAAAAIHPIDADAGGTWIAASAHGLVLALLNGDSASGDSGRTRESRGLIIPQLLEAGPTPSGQFPIESIDPRRFRPFHLVIAGDRDLVDIVSNGARLEVFERDAGERVLRTSSSWQPRRVRAFRTRLFDASVPSVSVSAQTAFHTRRSAVSGLGVEMSRTDASTVSVTTIDARDERFTLTYRPLTGEAGESRMSLARL